MSICANRLNSLLWGATLVAGFAITPVWGQNQYPPPQYPQQNQQYPQQTQQYPPENQQYPQQNQQYPQQQQPYPQQYPAQQGQYPSAPPRMAPAQLDQLVGPIALYPDGLLAQVLTGSTFYPQIPDAAGWANQHSYLKGPALANAIQQDRLPWDPAVLALLPFPQVLNYMASNMGWTQALGNEVLAQRGEVMDAVQRERQRAYQYGYLRDNQYERVEAQPNYIEIVPVAARRLLCALLRSVYCLQSPASRLLCRRGHPLRRWNHHRRGVCTFRVGRCWIRMARTHDPG